MNPYNWQYPQKSDTMFLSTINQPKSFSPFRESTFLRNDIQGSSPKRQIPIEVNRANYSLSTRLQPSPYQYQTIGKVSDPLKINDIQGTSPKAVQFKTNRIVNPLIPKYKLPSVPNISMDPGRNFIRDTLDVSDINNKETNRKILKIVPDKEQIKGSAPRKLFKTIDTISKFNVKDINNDLPYFMTSKNIKRNPLNPEYIWRDDGPKNINQRYGKIQQIKPQFTNSMRINRRNDFVLNIGDIQGAHVNSYNERKYFLDKRQNYKDYMNNDDIQKTHASSLKKGITRKNNINPLVPNYSLLYRQ